MMKRIGLIVVALSAFSGLQGAVVKFQADRVSCVYEVGETAKLSVTVAETNDVALSSGRIRLVVDNFGDVRCENSVGTATVNFD